MSTGFTTVLYPERLATAMERKTARIGVLGLGYVGLPLAVEFGNAGFPALGLDVEEGWVRSTNAGESQLRDVADSELRRIVSQYRFHATTGFSAIVELHTVNICVPTPLRKPKTRT